MPPVKPAPPQSPQVPNHPRNSAIPPLQSAPPKPQTSPRPGRSFLLNPDPSLRPPDYNFLPIPNHRPATTSSKSPLASHPDPEGLEEFSLDTPPGSLAATPTPTPVPRDAGNAAPTKPAAEDAAPGTAPPENTTSQPAPPKPRKPRDRRSDKQKAAAEDPDYKVVEREDVPHTSWNASADHPRKYPGFEKAGRKSGPAKLVFGDGEGGGGEGGNGEGDGGDKDQVAGGRGEAYDDATWGDVAKELIIAGGRGLWKRRGEVGKDVLDWVDRWR